MHCGFDWIDGRDFHEMHDVRALECDQHAYHGQQGKRPEIPGTTHHVHYSLAATRLSVENERGVRCNPDVGLEAR